MWTQLGKFDDDAGGDPGKPKDLGPQGTTSAVDLEVDRLL
jgi:hypothetical protein